MLMTPDTAIVLAWLAWIVSWMAAAGWRKRTIARPKAGVEMVNLLTTAAGIWMLFSTHAAPADPTRQALNMSRLGLEPVQVWTTPLPIAWGLFGAAVLGFLFCWWARVHLGALWSGTVTVKPGHKVIDTGPYRLVRHPIYTGLILSAAATALEKATLLGLGGAALIALGFWFKARLEEQFLRRELGPKDYDRYAARTPMLIPGLSLGRSRP
jgi:protein-S-isoprenylcysteine O-methyltransferase Ste14